MRRAALLLAVAVLAGCGGSSGLPADAVARVGDRTVTKAELAAEVAKTRRVYEADGRAFPARGTTRYHELELAVLKLLVDRTRLEVEAADAGVEVTEADVDRRLARLKRVTFGGSVQRYREMLRRTGFTNADVRQSIRVLLLTAALRGKAPGSPKISYAEGFVPRDEG